jgi:hypothetical protein
MAEGKPRLMRVADFTAESLEAEARRLPPSQSERAAALREMAALFRASPSQKMVRLWEVPDERDDRS